MRNGKAAESEERRPPDKPSDFERFEDFARKVFSVPKAEVAEQEKRYQRRRRRKRTPT